MKYTLALLIPFLLVGCYSERMYEGDGVLKDKGILAMYGRYDLELGVVSLSESKEYIFRAGRLPQEDFVVGFNVLSLPDSEMYSSIKVRLEVLNENQEIVINEEGPLSEWVWGHAAGDSKSFVYRRGETVDIKISEGLFKPKPIKVKADKGHGSYFMPRSNGRYKIRVTVHVDGARKSEFADVVLLGTGT
jgi:hypothetical protein